MTATQAQALDSKMVNAISSSVMEVLSSMANTSVTLKSVNARTDYTPIGDISAIIGIMGESGEGMVGLCFNSPLAKMMVARLLGIEPTDLSDDDCCDGIGEYDIGPFQNRIKRKHWPALPVIVAHHY